MEKEARNTAKEIEDELQGQGTSASGCSIHVFLSDSGFDRRRPSRAPSMFERKTEKNTLEFAKILTSYNPSGRMIQMSQSWSFLASHFSSVFTYNVSVASHWSSNDPKHTAKNTRGWARTKHWVILKWSCVSPGVKTSRLEKAPIKPETAGAVCSGRGVSVKTTVTVSSTKY